MVPMTSYTASLKCIVSVCMKPSGWHTAAGPCHQAPLGVIRLPQVPRRQQGEHDVEREVGQKNDGQRSQCKAAQERHGQQRCWSAPRKRGSRPDHKVLALLRWCFCGLHKAEAHTVSTSPAW